MPQRSLTAPIAVASPGSSSSPWFWKVNTSSPKRTDRNAQWIPVVYRCPCASNCQLVAAEPTPHAIQTTYKVWTVQIPICAQQPVCQSSCFHSLKLEVDTVMPPHVAAHTHTHTTLGTKGTLFSVVYFSRETLPPQEKEVKGHYWGTQLMPPPQPPPPNPRNPNPRNPNPTPPTPPPQPQPHPTRGNAQLPHLADLVETPPRSESNPRHALKAQLLERLLQELLAAPEVPLLPGLEIQLLLRQTEDEIKK